MNFKSSHWLGSQVEAFWDLNKDPKVGWFEINVCVRRSFSPILQIYTLYFVEFDAIQTQYSCPPSRYTGALNTKEVATDPSPDVETWFGSNIISENGRIFVVGNPPCIVRIWKVTGISKSSFDLKNTSHLVKNTPVASSTKNDCANGSYHPVIRSEVFLPSTCVEITCVPVVLETALSSNSCLFSIRAFLTEIIFSWTVSKVPLEVNPSSAIVVATFWSFESLFINVKTLDPVSNFGWTLIFGLGTLKLPIKVADMSEINLTFVIVAWAPLVPPIRTIPLSTLPLNCPWGSFDSENVSTFKIVDVDEYVPWRTWLV